MSTRQASIDYANDSFMDTVSQELTHMTWEEQVLRTCLRREQHTEAACRQQEYQKILDRLFVQRDGAVATLRTGLSPQAPVQVRKRFRYFPEILYTHRHFELLYVHSGRCCYHSEHQEQELLPGDFCLTEYGVPHRVSTGADDCILIELMVHRDSLESLCTSLLEEQNVLSRYFKGALYGAPAQPLVIFQTGGEPAVQYYLFAMLCEYQQRLPHYAVMLEAFLNALLIILFTGCVPQEYYSARSDGLADAIRAYVLEHEQDVTLSDVARTFGYSVQHVGRIIHSAYGCSFSGLLRKLRMEWAARLLRETELSVSQIAAEVHCADASHFSRSFRQEYRLSPSQYRAAEQKGDRG